MNELLAFRPFLVTVLGLGLLVAGGQAATAQESGKPQSSEEAPSEDAPSSEMGVEVDMEALESLSPSRQKREEEPEPPAEAEKEASELEVPPAEPAEGAPPELFMPSEEEDVPAAQSPEAPMMQEDRTLPTGETDLAGRIITIPFKTEDADLSLDAASILDATAEQAGDAPVRLQLFAYAGTDSASPSRTRRLALERAIAIRGYLMDRGIDGTRIDLRPQGPAESGKPERVDIKFVQQ